MLALHLEATMSMHGCRHSSCSRQTVQATKCAACVLVQLHVSWLAAETRPGPNSCYVSKLFLTSWQVANPFTGPGMGFVHGRS